MTMQNFFPFANIMSSTQKASESFEASDKPYHLSTILFAITSRLALKIPTCMAEKQKPTIII